MARDYKGLEDYGLTGNLETCALMSLPDWCMLPVAILVATIATASGVGGATFFAPLFILALGIAPEVAIAAALISEVFGFASGLYAYARKRLLDYQLAAGMWLIVETTPMTRKGIHVLQPLD